MHGPGGSGKTFLYQCLIYKLRSEGRSVIVTATTGIAALLLPDGRTVHSTFGVPLLIQESGVSNINMQTSEAADLRKADLIIIDEVSIMSSHILTVVDRLFRDLKNNMSVPFGGTCVLIGGDFRQTLPIVPRGSQADIILATIKLNCT